MAGLMLCMTLALGGCKIHHTTVIFSTHLTGKKVFSIGQESCTTAEAKVLLLNYQNLYGTSYGVALWDQENATEELETYVKDLTLNRLAKIITLSQLAGEKEISLTKEEQSRINEAAEAYFATLTQEELDYSQAKLSTIQTLYRHLALAEKLYATLISDIEEEVSEDEARVMEVYLIYVTDEAVADTIATGLAAGKDFLALAGSYNEAAATELELCRGDLPSEVEEVAYALADGEISDVISASDGYYVIKCINYYNQELTEANKAKILEQRKQAAFDDVYEAYVESKTSAFNQEVWEEVTVETGEGFVTDSLFTVFYEYWES